MATRQRSPRLERVSNLLERSGLSHEEGRELLLPAWETAVARQLGDVGIDLDREAALLYYARHFDLDDAQLDHHGMLRQFVQGAAIAEAAAGLVPQRMNVPEGAPASALLRRSEQLVWLCDDVECCLGQLPPEPSTTITGVAAPDRNLPYYGPSRSWTARRRTRAGNPWHGANWRWPANTCISVDRISVSGWPTARW